MKSSPRIAAAMDKEPKKESKRGAAEEVATAGPPAPRPTSESVVPFSSWAVGASPSEGPQVSSGPQEEPQSCEEPLPPNTPVEFEEPTLASLIVESYEGGKVCGLFEGEGLAKFQGGNMYQGMFSEGLMHGQGTYTWANGVKYEGSFVKNVLTPQGRYTWPDGSTYEGEVKDGIRHGYGVFKSGTRPVSYMGQWCEGKRHGQGTLSYNQDSSSWYEGDFVNNIKSGQGIRCYNSGNVYEGQWERGEQHGEGRMKWLTTNEEYTGQWLNGKQHGHGTHTWYQKRIPGSQYPLRNQYVGEFVKGARHGHGMFTYASGAMYDGQWAFNKKHGMGKLVSQTGRLYEGEFVNDCLPGNPAPALFSAEIMKVVDGSRCLLVLGSDIEIDITTLLAGFPEKVRKEEIKQMEFAVLRHISELRDIYTFYSSVGFDRSPDNTFLMTRLQFWRFLKDCRLHHCNVTLADMDRILRNDETLPEEIHSPYEKLLPRIFFTHLVYLSFHIYQSEFGDMSPCLFRCFSKMMAKNILPNARQIQGIFRFQQEAIYALSYTDKCWEIYQAFCRPNSFAPYEPTMTMRHFLWMLKDLKLINKQLNPTQIVTILAKDSLCVRDGDAVNAETEIVFLEFLEALLDCALLYVTDTMLKQHVHSCSEGVEISLLTREWSSCLAKARDGTEDEKRPQHGWQSSCRERRGIQTEKVGNAQEDQKDQLVLWKSRICIFLVGHLFAKFDHLQVLKEIALDTRVREAELAEQRRIQEEAEQARLYAKWEAEEARKLEEEAAEKAAMEIEAQEAEEGSIQQQTPPKAESPVLPQVPPSSKAATTGKKKKK